MELHERIAFVRKAAGLTQEQLGEKLVSDEPLPGYTDVFADEELLELTPENFPDFAP